MRSEEKSNFGKSGWSSMAMYIVGTPYVAVHFSSLRTGIMSGSACPTHRMQQANDRMYMTEITNPYGLTESGPVMTMTRYFEKSIERKCATIGQAVRAYRGEEAAHG